MALTGSGTAARRLPLLGAKRTSERQALRSVRDPGCVKTKENSSNFEFRPFVENYVSMKSMV